MNAVVKVARYHLATPVMLLGLPWMALALAFVLRTVQGSGGFRGGVLVLFLMFFIMGGQRVGRWLPFGLALGVTRRSFYAGTAMIGIAMALVSGLTVAGLQAIERATGGWGLSLTVFEVPGLVNGSPGLLGGPWYDTWLTSFVGLSALFVYGMWYGIVNRRWGVLGLIAFIAIQVLVGLTYSWFGQSWHLASMSALDLTGIVAALAAVFLAGGHVTIRRATV